MFIKLKGGEFVTDFKSTPTEIIMKKILSILAVAMILAACATTKTPEPAPAAATEQAAPAPTESAPPPAAQ